MNRNINAVAKLQNQTTKELAFDLAKEFLQHTPGANLAVSTFLKLRRQKQLDRLGTFFESAQIDTAYIELISNNETEQELFSEFLSKIIQTTPKVAIVTLALIFRDNSAGDSLKSLSAKALGDITQGTLNVFNALMERLNDPACDRFDDFQRLHATSTPVFFSIENTGIVKEPKEWQAFASDLISRNICSKGSVIGDQGTSVGVNVFTLFVYHHMKIAQKLITHH